MSDLTAGALAVLVSALVLALQHWSVTKLRQEPLPPLVNYMIGSLAVWLGFAVWAYLTGNAWAAIVLLVINVLSGGLVILMHLAESVVAGQGHQRRADYLDARHTGEDDETSS